jgi:6-phospho-beta-glucosidase
MKIAVIGGASVRTPLLVNGLTESDLPIEEIGLFDIDQDRLSLVSSVAAGFARCVRPYADAAACVSGASFVILSIRVGGIAARARDEAIAVEHGIVGQETVGPGGFAMAMRNAPHAVAYARLIEREASRAWIINFTNPVGIVTQAMTSAAGGRVIGICDTPTELFESVAHALGVESARCHFDYFGLNHLGWLREVYCDGEPQLHRLWQDPERLTRVYRTALFDTTLLRSLKLLPTEYLFYYYSPRAALENIRTAGRTRGRAIAFLNDELFRDLAVGGADRRHVYARYLQARDAGYLGIESGASRAAPIARGVSAHPTTGYDAIAVSVVRAIHFGANAVIPLNVPNRGALREVDDSDVVEVPCVVNSNGAHPLIVGAVPDRVRDLLLRVKEYERLTVEAAASRSIEAARRALARNPLVDDPALARTLVDALQPW